jgi:nitronate monooxygenase
MPFPASLQGKLALPAIAAPMFLVSGPELVVAACRAGVIGTFPALNQRSSEGFEGWLTSIGDALRAAEAEREGTDRPPVAPYGVNLIVHRSNPRVQTDLELCIKHKVPLVITSLGAVADLVQAVHRYGGLVFHDVTTLRHAEKAAEAGVDGLILVCAGAGGHAGTLSPFALLPEVRRIFKGTIVLAGALSDGRSIAAARLLGADLAYLGTRFIATRESMAPPEYKQMILDGAAADIVYTSAISGIPGSFLRPSIRAAGLDPDDLPVKPGGYKAKAGGEGGGSHTAESEAKAWKAVWSAGQGIGSITDIPSVSDLVRRLRQEYAEAKAAFFNDPY